MAPEQNAPVAEQPPHLTSHRINGVVDLPRPTRISGWAIDRADPDAAVIVEIFRAGVRLAEIEASQFRPDLERSGLGTGRYGFSLDLDTPVPAGLGFTVTARARTRDGVTDALRQIGTVAPSEDPTTRLQQEILRVLNDLAAAGVMPDPTPETGEDPQTTRLLAICERLETLQARQETRPPAIPSAVERPVPAWMRRAVVLALVLGLASLATGIFSLLQP